MKKRESYKKGYFCTYISLLLFIPTHKISSGTDEFKLEPVYTRTSSLKMECPDANLSEQTRLKLRKLIPEINLFKLSDIQNWIKNQATSDAVMDIKSIGISSKQHDIEFQRKSNLAYEILAHLTNSLALIKNLNDMFPDNVPNCNFSELYKNTYEDTCEKYFLHYCPPYKIRLLKSFGNFITMEAIPVEKKEKLQKRSVNVTFTKSGKTALVSYIRYRGRSPKKLLTLLVKDDIYKSFQTDIIFDNKKIFGDFRKRFLEKLIMNEKIDTETLNFLLPRFKNKRGFGLLHHCTLYGFIHLVNKLLENKIMDINSTGITLATPIMIAIAANHEEIARLLFKNGADMYVKNFDGKSANDILPVFWIL